MAAASATATLLGLNKRLRDGFIQPLKQCMVNKQEVDYKDILEKVAEIHEEVVDRYRHLDHQFSQRQEKIMAKAMIDLQGENQRLIVLGRGQHQKEKLRQGGR